MGRLVKISQKENLVKIEVSSKCGVLEPKWPHKAAEASETWPRWPQPIRRPQARKILRLKKMPRINEKTPVLKLLTFCHPDHLVMIQRSPEMTTLMTHILKTSQSTLNSN